MTISLDEAKAHLRVEHTEDDALIEGYIQAATRNAENITGTQISRKQITKRFAEFSSAMALEWPLISVDQIKYTDTDGVEQTLYDTSSDPVVDSAVFQTVRLWQPGLAMGQPYITLAHDQSWPDAQSQPEAVTIVATCGYAQEAIPGDIRVALLLLVGNFYENRESTVRGNIIAELPMGYEALLQSHRMYHL